MVSLNNDIRFTNQIADSLRSALDTSSFSKVFVLTDKNTNSACLPIISNILPDDAVHIVIEPGEVNKTLETCEKIWQALTDANADRYALLVNLGGGVICDMGGFCARTYKRGISFWNVPTTVLSQVDASVGGKLGIDFGEYKNHIGLFSEPDIVFIDPVFFKTLPKDEIVSGYAEMIKHTLIRDKEGFEKIIQQDLWSLDWFAWITKSVNIKKSVVEEDPIEKGVRKILNFGHTIGHAVESYFLRSDKPLKHGEAIAIGMIAESYLSTQKCSLTNNDLEQIIKLIKKEFPLAEIPAGSITAIIELAIHDKKNKDGNINAVLLNGIGNPVIDVPITREEIKNSLDFYNQQLK